MIATIPLVFLALAPQQFTHRARTPRIAALSASSAAPSARIVIEGAHFGREPGAVLVGGQRAIVTRWDERAIHAYVPESSSPGQNTLLVEKARSAARVATTLQVVPRGSTTGRIRWFFEMDRWMTLQFLEVGPEGTLYCSDHLGLYALSPQGALLWFSPESGGGNPISVDANGTIYTGTQRTTSFAGRIRALNPDGSLRWEFVPPGSSPMYLAAGPNVGPDGNIYAMQDPDDEEGLGFFSLDPDGNLRWSDTTSATLHLVTSYRSEIVFSQDRLFGGVVNVGSGGQPIIFGYTLDGQEIWSSSQVQNRFQSYPRVDPLGRAVGRRGQTGLIATQSNGHPEWITYHPSQINVENLPTVDSMGNIYCGASRGEMWAVDANGTILWVLPTESLTNLSKAGIAPDDSVIVAHYARSMQPNAITGHDPSDGSREWLAEFENVGGLTAHVTSLYPRFSPESTTAYVTTSSGGPTVDYSRIYALCLRSCSTRSDERR